MEEEEGLKSLESIFKTNPIPKQPKEGPRSERNALIGAFTKAVNETRVGQTIILKNGKSRIIKPYSAGYVASKMARSKISSVEDLRDFYKQCKQRKNFGSWWHWSLDAKNSKKPT